MYSGQDHAGPTKQLMRIDGQDLSNVGSIKEMALFSRIVNYQEQSTQKLRLDYGDLHPKILELGLRLINESYGSSN
jgi:hypothetical protein